MWGDCNTEIKHGDGILSLESGMELSRMVDHFHDVGSRRMLKVDASKSKILVFRRKVAV